MALLAGAVSVGAAAAFLPAAGLVLAAGLLAAGIAVPVRPGLLASRARARQAAARGELSAELVELMGAGAELVAFGVGAARARARRAADRALVALGRRDAVAGGVGDGSRLVDDRRHGDGRARRRGQRRIRRRRLDRVLIAMLALLALASFEAVHAAVGRGPGAVGGACGWTADPRAHRRGAAVRTPPPRHPRLGGRSRSSSRGPCSAIPRQPRPRARRVSLRLDPGERVALLGPSGAGKTTVVEPPAPVP